MPVCAEVRPEMLDVFLTAPHAVLLAHLAVHAHHGCEARQHERTRHSQLTQAAPPQSSRTPQAMHHHSGDRHSAEIQRVKIGRGLLDPEKGERREHPSGRTREVAMQCPQHQRSPAGPEHLDVRKLRNARLAERKGNARYERGVTPAGQFAPEQIGAGACEHNRQDNRHVVGDKRTPASQPDKRCGPDRDAEEVFGERQRFHVGIKNGRVPQALQSVLQALGVPAKDPCVEQRIAEIAGNDRAKVFRQWPRGDDGQQTKEADDGGGLDPPREGSPSGHHSLDLSWGHG